ncbi:hypothetical protein EN851_20200 [Mesorhizobium sp. M8A.F.Ca.ET.208.01.1.1]|uniref:hypothetical protein n=1 Tax=unclassified Mesorhizobium TaxID=325217 RepID=UPI001093CA79|nr:MULTISPECIES: hypothetical protein [unclassified Mesorhizobium]TGQ89961.1 hypothetical protein EN851_20200 [Mesorhizobium sp. M8A.F.Ca.ET.208.01.1.1]TGT50800.1 hypothetical protein EN810_20100 [Mesorhizobium sp. M8A.F.Ca.ET.167.01.1.1]
MKLVCGLVFAIALATPAFPAEKGGPVAGGELKFVADYCHLTLTPAGKRFLAKTYKANPHLFDAQYASEESGLRFDDNNKLMDELPCEAWYGDYLKGGSSYLGFQPFVEIAPE